MGSPRPGWGQKKPDIQVVQESKCSAEALARNVEVGQGNSSSNRVERGQ